MVLGVETCTQVLGILYRYISRDIPEQILNSLNSVPSISGFC